MSASKQQPHASPTVSAKPIWSIIFCLLLIGGICMAAQIFMPRGAFVNNPVPTAWEYPTLDMGAFFMRAVNPTYLPHDLYTNSLAEPNPRWVFGYFVLGLAELLLTDWYNILFLLKSIFTLTLPCFIFLMALSSYRHHRDALPPLWGMALVALVAAWAGASDQVFDLFSVAIWHPAYGYAIPQNLAIVFSLIACFLYSPQRSRKKNILLWGLFFAAALVHPSSALFIVLCFLILHYRYILSPFALLFSSAYIAAIIILFAFFSSDTNLSTTEFIEHYAFSRLPFHYMPSRYDVSGLWREAFFTINGSFIACIIIGIATKKPYLWKIALCALIAYSGAIAGQYLLVELLQIKLFTLLGVSRFTMFGFWMMLACFALLLPPSRVIKMQAQPSDLSQPDQFPQAATNPPSLIPRYFLFGILISSIIFTEIYHDDPASWSKQEDAGLYEWIKDKTDADDVFVAPEMMLGINIQMLTYRALYSTSPSGPVIFNQSFMAEDKRRVENIFGNYTDHMQYEQSKNMPFSLAILLVYHNITPEKILAITQKDRIDYLIFKTLYSLPPHLEGYPYRYKSKYHTVFSVRDIKQQFDKRQLVDVK